MGRAEYMKKYRKKKKVKQCSNKFCENEIEFYHEHKGYCLVHYLLMSRKEGGIRG